VLPHDAASWAVLCWSRWHSGWHLHAVDIWFILNIIVPHHVGLRTVLAVSLCGDLSLAILLVSFVTSYMCGVQVVSPDGSSKLTYGFVSGVYGCAGTGNNDEVCPLFASENRERECVCVFVHNRYFSRPFSKIRELRTVIYSLTLPPPVTFTFFPAFPTQRTGHGPHRCVP